MEDDKQKVKNIFRRVVSGLGFDYDDLAKGVDSDSIDDEFAAGILVILLGCIELVYDNEAPEDLTLEYVLGLK